MFESRLGLKYVNLYIIQHAKGITAEKRAIFNLIDLKRVPDLKELKVWERT